MNTLLLFIPVAFLTGSIPFGLLIARAKGLDIRQHGSGNIGATNVGRVLGRKLGIFCFVLDVLKGLVPTLTAGLIAGVAGSFDVAPNLAWAWLAVMAASILGHIFSPWIGFKGGKGVATGLGSLLAVFPLLTIPAVAAAIAWIVTIKCSKFVSLSSIIAAITLPIATALLLMLGAPDTNPLPWLTVTSLLAGLVVLRHRSNIKRLLNGTEPRIGRKTTDQPTQTDPPSEG